MDQVAFVWLYLVAVAVALGFGGKLADWVIQYVERRIRIRNARRGRYIRQLEGS